MFTEIFLTLAAFAGLVIFYLEEIKALLRKIKGLLYLRSEDVRIKRKEKKKAAEISDELGDAKEFTLMESVSRLLQATLGFRGKKTAAGFIALSVAAGLAVFYLLRYKVTPLLAFAAGLSALSAPFLMLLCRLQSIRVENSKEGDVMITELLDNYKVDYFDIQDAIKITALNIKEAPRSRKLLFNLSKGLNTASDKYEIKKLLDEFRFSIGTSWAGVMADNMYFALVSGIRITEAMEDLIKTVEKARKIEEFARRESNEGRLMLKYMAPCCYLLTVAAGIKYFGLSPEEFVKYQFMTETGMAWFIIAALTYCLGIAARSFLSRSKLDI